MILTMVGNYPKISNRPGGQKLRRAIALMDGGKITPKELARVEDEVTLEVIEEQIKAGLDLVTDGQIRWEDGQTYFARGIEGFEMTGLIRYFDTNTYYRQPIARAKLCWRGPISVRDYEFASKNSPRPVKAVITGPYTLAKLSQSTFHRELRDFALNLAEVLNQEARALERAGALLIQFDEPAIVKNKGDWPIFEEAMGILVSGLSVKTALYTYFGDVSGLPGFFNLPFKVFGLDFVMGPGNFDLLKSFPREKELGLGILDARNVRLESVESLAEAIGKASRQVALEHIHLSPSCGLEFLPRETAHAKLVRMVEGARHVRGERV